MPLFVRGHRLTLASFFKSMRSRKRRGIFEIFAVSALFGQFRYLNTPCLRRLQLSRQWFSQARVFVSMPSTMRRSIAAVSPPFSLIVSLGCPIFSSLWRYFRYHFLRDFASFVIRSRRRRRLGDTSKIGGTHDVVIVVRGASIALDRRRAALSSQTAAAQTSRHLLRSQTRQPSLDPSPSFRHFIPKLTITLALIFQNLSLLFLHLVFLTRFVKPWYLRIPQLDTGSAFISTPLLYTSSANLYALRIFQKTRVTLVE